MPLQTLKFCYFISSGSTSIPNRLLTMLSLVDLASLVSVVVFWNIVDFEFVLYMIPIVTSGYFLSGLITCFLSVSRLIAFVYPFYYMDPKTVYMMLGFITFIFIFIKVIGHVLSSIIDSQNVVPVYFALASFCIGSITLIVFVSTIALIYNLNLKSSTDINMNGSSSNHRKSARRVTITIVMISVVFITKGSIAWGLNMHTLLSDDIAAIFMNNFCLQISILNLMYLMKAITCFLRYRNLRLFSGRVFNWVKQRVTPYSITPTPTSGLNDI